MIRKRFMVMMNDNQYFKAVEDEYIKSLPVKSFPGTICLVDNPSVFEKARYILSRETILGFDTETKPSFKKGRTHSVALIQIATDDHAFLFKLNKISLPPFIVSILEDKSIIKVGVALRDDLAAINKIKSFNPGGFVDLQQFVKQFGIEDNGLKKLVANVLGFRISKKFQTSNWEQDPLDTEQLNYAATDAWVCRRIYEDLIKRLEN
jgi:ribonuclease D